MASNENEVHNPVTSVFLNLTVREVYKAGWVRRPSSEKKSGPFGRKYDRLWAMFCIHDDVHPFLEFYVDPKSSPAHRPVWVAFLRECLHVSPSIIISGDCYEFVITMQTSVIRMGAVTQEQMNEWVEVLRTRLRIIGVLEPKDNLYSRLPESKSLVSTRDPNSPLPLPPPRTSGTQEIAPEAQSDTETVYEATNESIEEPNLIQIPVNPHVTVITVGIEQNVESSEESLDTRAASQSIPVSERPTVNLNQLENSYEAIFVPSNINRDQAPSRRRLHSENEETETPPEVELRNSASVRVPENNRHGVLRRSVSVGSEVPSNQFASQTRDRRRDLLSPVLLSRNPTMSPVILNPQLRLAQPLIRPTFPVLQPLLGHHGGPVETALSLKERQVRRLLLEMQHPAGVRVVLKKRDCSNTIAFVDALSAVWIAGWRQKEKPLLYNVFHIGDQVIRVGVSNVTSAADAYRLIKSEPANQVEFIVRRMPFGRVFHLRRESEGQNVGVITEGNTAEIRDIIPGGLAAQQGVPPRALSPLTSSPVTWTLTEINGRPLNLCSKEGEAKDRLNAVGRAITILIQPTDFVKTLKKQLKSVRSYKDYLLA